MSTDKIICRRNVPKSYYDKLYYAKRGNKFLKAVNPQIIEKLLAQRRSYNHVARVAIERWYKVLSEKMQLLYLLNHCTEYDLSKVEAMSRNVFRWSLEEFLKRRELKDCIWVDVVFRNSSEKCLTKQKTKEDLTELKKFIDLIYQTIKDVVFYDKEVDFEEQLFKPLRAVEQYSYTSEIGLESNRTELRAKFEDLVERIVAENVIGVLKLQQVKILSAENEMMNSHIWDPIEVRYELNWYGSIVNQHQYQADIDQYRISSEARKFTVKTVTEKACSAGVLDSYYSDAEEYKRRISDLQDVLDTEVEELENTTSFIKGKIERLNDTKRLYTKEIQRFHREIEARLELEERWRIQAEKEREAKLAAELAKQEAARLKKLREDRLARKKRKGQLK